MKKALSCVALVCGLAAGATAPGAAGEGQSVSRFCTSVNDWGLTHAECVTLFSRGKAVPHVVERCMKPEVQKAVGANDLEECIGLIRSMVR